MPALSSWNGLVDASPGPAADDGAVVGDAPSERDLLRAAFDGAAIGAALVGPDGTILASNRAFAAVVARDPAELVGRGLADLAVADDLGVLAAALAAAREAGAPGTQVEVRLERGSGGAIWGRLTLAATKIGARDGLVAQLQDVTPYKAFGAELRANEARFRALVEDAPDAVVLLDAGGAVRLATPAVERMLGRGAEALAAPDPDLLHPADEGAVHRAFSRVFASAGARAALEFRVRHADGSWRWLDVAARNRLDDPAVSGVVVNLRDVTERKRLEGELRESEARYRGLVERLPAVVYLLANDANQTPLYFSPRVADLLGIAPEQALARAGGWLDRVHPDDRGRVAAESARTDATGEPFRMEYRHRRGDGSWVWVRDECEAVRADDGAVVAWHGVLFDVSDERRLRDELVAAKEAAEEASRLKGAFLRTMSHELRTPLTAIMGYAGVLLDGIDGDLTPAQAEDVGCIARGANRLLGLVNDVLDLSKIQAGAMDLRPERCALAHVAEAVVAEVFPLAEAKGLRVRADVPDGLAVVADPMRLHQVLLNLVGNAVKFTEAGSIAVSAEHGGGGVRIDVADTGIGITPDALQHVFDEFRQADEGATRKYGGSGLGLAITRRLVELHGGTLGVRSAPGRGTTFTVTLPCAGAGDRASAPAASAPGNRFGDDPAGAAPIVVGDLADDDRSEGRIGS